jgi:hypothetical protein
LLAAALRLPSRTPSDASRRPARAASDGDARACGAGFRRRFGGFSRVNEGARGGAAASAKGFGFKVASAEAAIQKYCKPCKNPLTSE